MLVECVQISRSSAACNARMKELTKRVRVCHQNIIITFLELQVSTSLSPTVELDLEVSNVVRLSSAPNRASWDTSDSELTPNANRVVAVRIGVQVVERMVSRVTRRHRRWCNGVRISCALCSRTI
jgi:hypothetical protein